MPEPVLSREVELPRTRSSGTAVVLVAAVAMFSAVGASAFAVRMRMHGEHACARARAATPVATPTPPEAPEAIPVTLVATPQGSPQALSAKDEARVGAYEQAVAAGDVPRALTIYNALPADSVAAQTLAAARNQLAASYLHDELERLAEDIEPQDCAAIEQRLQTLSQLLPERTDLPRTMATCRR